MTLDDALEAILGRLDRGLAVGYTDMEEGSLLGVKANGQYPMELFEEFASISGILIQGRHIVHAEDIVDRLRAKNRSPGHHYFNELVLRTDNTVHVFLRGKKHPTRLLVLVCQHDVNVGMIFFRAQEALKLVENAV